LVHLSFTLRKGNTLKNGKKESYITSCEAKCKNNTSSLTVL